MHESIDTEELDAVHGGYSQAMFSAMQHAVGMGLTVNSTVTGGHAPNSMHYKGRAFDAIGTEQQMQGFYNWAAANTHPHELIHRNHFLKDGHAVHPIGGHNGHVHSFISQATSPSSAVGIAGRGAEREALAGRWYMAARSRSRSRSARANTRCRTRLAESRGHRTYGATGLLGTS